MEKEKVHIAGQVNLILLEKNLYLTRELEKELRDQFQEV